MFDRTPPDRPRRRLPTWNPERMAQVLRALFVLTVTAVAAIQSYNHIAALALAHGQTRLDAHLLPLSVDGLIGAGSLQLVAAAWRSPLPAGTDGRWRQLWQLLADRDPLAQAAIGLGVAATLAANVAAGWAWGPIGAACAGWPAAAFVLAAEMAITSVRKTRRRAAVKRPEPEPEAARGRTAGRAPADARPAAGRALTGPRAAAEAIAKGAPGITGTELAALMTDLGRPVAPRTARRWLAEVDDTAHDLEPIAAANGHA